MKNLVILDSGHGYDTKGKRNEKENFYEFDFNNKMQYLIRDMLKYYDIEVVMTNPNPHKDSDILLSERVKRANSWYNKRDNQLFISIHANAYSDAKVRGTETYTSLNCSNKSKLFCEMVNEKIYQVFKQYDKSAKNRGCKQENFYVIKNTIIPAVLIEYGFYSNLADLKILREHQNELAQATVKAILEYFNLEMKEIKPPSNHLYRVCVGAFSDINNARKIQEELKSKNIESYIYIEK